jgi:hypothetical protein
MMKPLRLLPALLAALLLAAPAAHAQKEGEPPSVNLSTSSRHPVGRVYRAAMDAVRGQGFVLRVLGYEQMLMTQPQPRKVDQLSGVVVLFLEFAAKDDSTTYVVNATAFPENPEKPCQKEECSRLLALAIAEAGGVVNALQIADSVMAPLPPSPADSLAAAGALGYARTNPILVGGGVNGGAANERRYLASLRGPGGETLRFERLGSCCHFRTPNGPRGTGLLDVYEVTHDGLARPVVLYLNMYDGGGESAVPVGFTRAPGETPVAAQPYTARPAAGAP